MGEYFGKDVKLIVSEIDGVLTDGTYAEDEIGNVLYKTFNVKDFSAINELKKYFKFVFMSADNRINYNMCNRRNIAFFWARNEREKFIRLGEILRKYNCTPDQTIYIASLMNDKRCIQTIPCSICPDDAGNLLKNLCFTTFIVGAGFGVFVEMLDLLQYRIEKIKNAK